LKLTLNAEHSIKRPGKFFKIALSSFSSKPNIKENLKIIEKVINKAFKRNCVMVCFPECALSGLPTEDYSKDIRMATEIPGRITKRLARLAKKYNLYIAIGLLERDKKKLFDTAILFSNTGEIVLKYRRINPQWHSQQVDKRFYCEGKSFKICSTPFGKIGLVICGDMFDYKVTKLIKKLKPDYLIIPMSRSYGSGCQNRDDWNKKEKWVYARQVKRIGVDSLLINDYEPSSKDGSFGGTLVISKNGKILSETEIGKSSILFYDSTT
jgi:N-carbamoylputrescine amidase